MLDADAIFAACPSGAASGAWRTALERGFGLGKKIRPGQALAVWTADLLRRELPGHLDGVTLWISGSGMPEVRWAELADGGGPAPLTVTDGKIVWAHGAAKPFDVSVGNPVEPTGDDWFHVSVFNLRTLYQLCHDRATKWTEQQQKSGPTPTPQPSAS
jgi:hypothetical protein